MVLVWKVIKKPLSTDHNSPGLTAEKWDLCSNILGVVCSGALCDRWTNYGPGWAIYADWDLDWWEPKCIEKPTLYGLNVGGLICVALGCLYKTWEEGEHFYFLGSSIDLFKCVYVYNLEFTTVVIHIDSRKGRIPFDRRFNN